MLGFLSACSLEQRESGSQVRIQIDPSVLRASTAQRRGMLQAQGGQQTANPSADIPTIAEYFLINVEGPGIPFVEPQSLPCLKIGIGASVLVPASLGAPIGPIELWVPAGLERKITLYEITLQSSQNNFPAFGASASQFFMSQGPGLSGVPFRHGEVVIPNLVAEQSVELVHAGNGTVPFCPAQFQGPPVLVSGTLTLQNYRPWRNESANLYEPHRSGPILFWAPPANSGIVLRISGEVLGGTSPNIALYGSLSPTSSSIPAIFSTQVSSPDILGGGGRIWFERAYSVSTPDVYQHAVGGVVRTIPIGFAGPAPVTASVADSLPVSGFVNVYKINVLSNFNRILPVVRDAVFAVNASGFSRFEVVPAPLPSGIVGNPTPPPCPREGANSEPLYLEAEGCAIYVAAISNQSEEQGPDALLELDIESSTSSSGFRRAQLNLGELSSKGAPTPLVETLSNRPDVSQVSESEQDFEIGLSADGTGLEAREIVRGEISGPGFRQEFEAENFQGPSSMPVRIFSDQEYTVTQPANQCITRVSLLVRGIVSNPGGVSAEQAYRREIYNLPMCVWPSVPSGLTVSQIGEVIKLSWSPSIQESANTASIVYEVERKDGPNGVFQLIQTVPTANCSSTGSVCRTDSAVQAGMQYVYRVRARSGSVVSPYSDQKSIRVLGQVAQPSILINDAIGLGRVSVSWNLVPGADQYLVKYRPAVCGNVNGCETNIEPPYSQQGGSFFVDVQLPTGIPHLIRLEARNNSGSQGLQNQNSGLTANARSSADVANVFSMDRPEVVSFCDPSPDTPGRLRINFTALGSASAPVKGANIGEVWARVGETGPFNIYGILNFPNGTTPDPGEVFPANPEAGVSSVIVPKPTAKTYFKIKVHNQFGSIESVLPSTGEWFDPDQQIVFCEIELGR